MERILIIGSPGSGKSYFAKKLSKITGIKLYHLDNLYWREDQTHLTNAELVDELLPILKTKAWIIDGNYLSSLDLRLASCTAVYFFDLPVKDCLQGIKSRLGKKHTDLPWIEKELDEEFVEFVQNFSRDVRPQIMNLLNKYPKLHIHIFNNRAEGQKYLQNL